MTDYDSVVWGQAWSFYLVYKLPADDGDAALQPTPDVTRFQRTDN